MASLATSGHLGKGDRLFWQGQPGHTRLSAGTRILALLGWTMAAGCAVVLLLGLANLDGMDGFFGFWPALVVGNGAGFLVLAIVLPAVARRAMRVRRCAATHRALLVVTANGAVRRREIEPGMRLEQRKRGAAARDILYEFPAARMVYRHGRSARRGSRPPARGFRGLSQADAAAALAALRTAQAG